MEADKTCRFTRTYSEIEGLQRANTVSYSAAASPRGALLMAVSDEAGERHAETVLCPNAGFEELARAARFLSENGVSACHWLDVLADMGITAVEPDTRGEFCGF